MSHIVAIHRHSDTHHEKEKFRQYVLASLALAWDALLPVVANDWQESDPTLITGRLVFRLVDGPGWAVRAQVSSQTSES